MVQIFSTATEYLSNSLTFTRGGPQDVVAVGVFHSLDPDYVPTEAEFTVVPMVQPGDPLAQGDNIDVLSLIGPRAEADLVLTVGTWQRWVMVTTATETIIRKVDVVEVS